VNPDVIIRDERPLLRAMTGGDTTGIFINCYGDTTNKRHLVHTDFFAVKVSEVEGSPALTKTAKTAEDQWTNVVRGPIINKGKAIWLKESQPRKGMCRAAQWRPMEGAAVVHHHLGEHAPLVNDTCTVPYARN